MEVLDGYLAAETVCFFDFCTMSSEWIIAFQSSFRAKVISARRGGADMGSGVYGIVSTVLGLDDGWDDDESKTQGLCAV